MEQHGERAGAAATETADEEPFTLASIYYPERRRHFRRLPRLVAGALRIVWHAAPRQFVTSAVLQLVAGVGVAAQILAGQRVLAEVIDLEAGGDLSAVMPWLIALTLSTTIVAFANLARGQQQILLGEMVARHTTDQVLDVSTNVELLAFDSTTFHNRLQRARANATVRPTQMANGVLAITSAAITIAGIAFALFLIEPLFLVLMLGAYVPLWIATTKASRLSYRFSVDQTERDRRREYLASVLTRKEEAAEVRSFGVAKFLRQRYEVLYDERISDLEKVVRRRQRLGFIGGLVTAILNAGALAMLVWFVSSGRLGLADAGAAAGALLLMGQRLRMLAGGTGSLYESSLFIEDFTDFVGLMPEIERQHPTRPAPDGFEVITAQNVNFTYPSQTVPALIDVSLEIQRGQVCALVGENGSGKTTLAKILGALYSPSSGEVQWDGVDISQCDPDQVREQVGVLFQDFVKYMLSARENISIGRHEKGDQMGRVIDAAKRAAAHDLIGSLDKGYESQLGAIFFGGRDLSVGQWQRLAMARAFFRDAPLLILDEPTAALDPRAEAELFDRIRDLYRGRTVLLISHRFSSVRNADQIFVLANGRLVERGTHLDLMALDGRYAELFLLQAAAYLDEAELPTSRRHPRPGHDHQE